MKNVLVITNNISLLGGTERAISNFYFLCNDIVCFTIISVCSSDNDKNAFGIPEKSVINLNQADLKTSIFARLKWYSMTIKKVNKICHGRAFDVVLTYGHNMSVMSPFLHVGSAKKYACEHINYDTIPSFSKLFMKMTYPMLDGVIALSNTAKKKLSGLNSNIFIIPNSTTFTSDILTNWNHKRIIMIGRLSPEKGYERLVPIAEYIQNVHPGWKIDVFGDGEMRNNLNAIFKENGVSNIITLKGITNDVKTELLNSDILLMTSYTEALPMAVIEAKVLGVPTIAYRCEGTEELIANGEDGYLVDRLDEFLESLTKLITDRSLLEKFGFKAHSNSLSFRPGWVKEMWNQLLNH